MLGRTDGYVARRYVEAVDWLKPAASASAFAFASALKVRGQQTERSMRRRRALERCVEYSF
jgi:ribosomal protein S13